MSQQCVLCLSLVGILYRIVYYRLNKAVLFYGNCNLSENQTMHGLKNVYRCGVSRSAMDKGRFI